MSDTPETDAARMFCYVEFGGDWVLLKRNCYEKHPEGDVVFCEVAEKLERERDEARRERDEALKEWDIARDGWSKALEERDEARRMATVWENLSSVWKRVVLRETSINGEEEA